MRNSFFILLIIPLLSNTLFSQKGDIEGYTTSVITKVYQYNIDTKKVDITSVKYLNPKLHFVILEGPIADSQLKSMYIIKIRKISQTGDDFIGDKVFLNSSDNSETWAIAEEDYKEKEIKTRYYIPRIKPNFGTLVVPFKFRPGTSDTIPASATTDVTIGATAGISFRISRYEPNFINISAIAGTSVISLDSASTKGFVRQPRSYAGFTTALAVLGEFSQFQAGFVFGIDLIFGLDSEKWKNQGKPWFSFAIGYQFLKRPTKSSITSY